MKKIIFLLISFYALYPLTSFPGDHNSLTCDKNFYDLEVQIPVKIFDDDNALTANTPTATTITEDLIKTYLRQNSEAIKVFALYKKQNRANIIAAINADLNSSSSKIKQRIKANHDATTYEGHPLQVTKWGDSLSDFVSFYGVLTPGALGAGVPIPPIGGVYGGSPLWIDSWSDYFTIYGQPPLAPVYVRNYGIATYETTSVMPLMGFSSYYDGVNGWWDINPTTNKCPKDGNVGKHFFSLFGMPDHLQNGKSALHSSLMVGGNDIMYHMIPSNVLPTLSTYLVDFVIENVTFMTDWHLENGKKVLLEGTIPVYSGPIDQYDSLIVNRGALCRPLADSFIKPQDIPWWACAFGPHVCYAMAKAAKEYDEKVAKSFADFTKKVMRKNKSSQTQFSDSFYSMNLNNFAGNLGDMFTAGGNVLEQGAQDNIVNIEAFIGGNLVAIGTGSPAAGVATAAELEAELSKQKKLKQNGKVAGFYG